MNRLVILFTLVLFVLSAVAPVVGCQQQPAPAPAPTPAPAPAPGPAPAPAPAPALPPKPDTPFIIVETPVGPSTVDEGEEAIFKASVQTNIAEKIEYRFDWEFDGYSSWSFSSSASHSWTGGTGMVVVRAQARYGDYISEWSSGKEVTIINPRKISRSPFLGQADQVKQYVTPNDPVVKEFLQNILQREAVAFNDFERLRDWVSSHISYKFDKDVHGVSDYWQYPEETLKLRTGDCEDFAIVLCSLLRAYGVPANQVYVAAGVSKDKTYHAYLVEKWYQGIWNVIEPQAGAWYGVLLGDWYTSTSFDTLCHFNDQYYSEGLPTLPAGAYEFQLSLIGGTSATFEHNVSSGQVIKASVEWLGKRGNPPEPFSIYGWGFRLYDPSGSIMIDWFGTNLSRTFSHSALRSGEYKVQVYTGGFLPISGRLTIDSTSQPTPTPTPTPAPTPSPQTLSYTMSAGGAVTSKVYYTNTLNAGDVVSGYIELTGKDYGSDWSYSFSVYFVSPTGNTIHTWSGNYVTDNHHDFSFTVPTSGVYKLYVAHNSSYQKHLTGEISPTGWQ
jgi:transglutaminase-like putative cysteine protease